MESRENATPVISKLNLLAMNTRVFNLYKTAKTGNIVKRSRIIFFSVQSNVHGFVDQKCKSIHPANWSKT